MTRRQYMALCGWCVAAVAVEIGLYRSYGHHDARFHWFTHFFVGASAALLVMSGVAAATRRAVPFPLVWPMLGHLVAVFPDFLFRAGIAHERWMDVFLGHVSSHFVPGRNLTWYVVFLLSLGVYLTVLDQRTAIDAVPRPLAIHRPLEAAHPRRGVSP